MTNKDAGPKGDIRISDSNDGLRETDWLELLKSYRRHLAEKLEEGEE